MRTLEGSIEANNSTLHWCRLVEYHIAKGTGKSRFSKDGWTTPDLCAEISRHLHADQVLHRRTLDSWRSAKTFPNGKYRVAFFNALFPRGRISAPDEFDDLRTALAEAIADTRNKATRKEIKINNTQFDPILKTSAGDREISVRKCLNVLMPDVDITADKISENVLKYLFQSIETKVKINESMAQAIRLYSAYHIFDDLPEHTEFQDDWFSPIMIKVSAGAFQMGAPNSDFEAYENEKPVKNISIDYEFSVSKSPITFKEFDIFCKNCGLELSYDEEWGRGDRPVIHVSWNDAQAYLRWLNHETSGGYRLLSEAEWEYIARAGTTGPYLDIPRKPSDIGNGSETLGETSKVCAFPPNNWGFCDVLGNVWEWVQDNWAPSYDQLPVDGSPFFVSENNLRCLRGGSWDCAYRNMRVTDRCRQGADNCINNVGFRIAKDHSARNI